MAKTEPKLSDLISDIPEALLKRTRSGFSVANSVSEEMLRSGVLSFTSTLDRGGSTFDPEPFEKIFGTSKRDSGTLVSAISVVVGLLTQTRVSADDFVRAAVGKLFEEKDAPAAARIARIVNEDRDRLDKTIERRYLAAQTLPSLNSFDVSVDLRLQFDGSEVREGVPVAVVYIATDGNPELWLQLTQADVALIVEKLGSISQQMNSAAELFSRSRGSKPDV